MIESTGAPGSQTSLREANSARILEAVKLYGQITQVELASVTGLSPATVSNIVRQLVDNNVLQTSATTRSGRRAQLVRLARSAVAAGIHIGHRAMEITIADTGLSKLARQRLPLPPEHRFDTTLDRAALLVAELTQTVGIPMGELAGVGVAMPSSTRREAGAAVSLAAWHDIDVAEVLGRRLGRPVLIQREGDAAAAAEARIGALRGTTLGVYVRVGETTDSSILLDGRVLRSETETAGGLAHVRVDPAGPICRCGARGCLNTVVSVDAMRELLRLSHGSMALRDIVGAARDGDRGCQQVIADAGRVIGTALADLATVLGPDLVVVGGPLMEAGEVLLEPIREPFRTRPLLPDPVSTVVAAQAATDAEALGMVALVLGTTGLNTAKEGGS